MRGIRVSTDLFGVVNKGVDEEVIELLTALSRVLRRRGEKGWATIPAHMWPGLYGDTEPDHFVELNLPRPMRWTSFYDIDRPPEGTRSAIRQLREALIELDPDGGWEPGASTDEMWDNIPVFGLGERPIYDEEPGEDEVTE